ncbi:MAG: glycosyltransferase [Gloeobacterales cyanobacterium]
MLKQIQYPSIEPSPTDAPRPFWSIMLTSYKRTEYLEQALRSVLAQAPGIDEMQIEVVDDCSPNKDKIETIVKEVGQGRISFYSSPLNNGIFGNWNVCIQRARGHWVHILSDDDLVMPGFYETYRQHIETYPCSVVLGPSFYIDGKGQDFDVSAHLQSQDGLLENALKQLSKSNRIHTPAIVVAREAYEKIGGFTTSLVFTPDWEMWTRLASAFKLAYINTPYSCFRIHSRSETNRLTLSGESILDCFNASKLIQSRIKDPDDLREVKHFTRNWLFQESLYLSQKLIQEGAYKSALINLGWTLKLCPSPSSTKYFLKILFGIPIKSNDVRKFY